MEAAPLPLPFPLLARARIPRNSKEFQRFPAGLGLGLGTPSFQTLGIPNFPGFPSWISLEIPESRIPGSQNSSRPLIPISQQSPVFPWIPAPGIPGDSCSRHPGSWYSRGFPAPGIPDPVIPSDPCSRYSRGSWLPVFQRLPAPGRFLLPVSRWIPVPGIPEDPRSRYPCSWYFP